MKMRTQSTEDI